MIIKGLYLIPFKKIFKIKVGENNTKKKKDNLHISCVGKQGRGYFIGVFHNYSQTQFPAFC